MREFLAALIVGMAITAFLMLVVIPAAVAGESPACVIKRDLDGRIHRSERVRRNFQRLNPCPSTGRTAGACPGYVKDHVIPLCACGSDSVGNLQWSDRRESLEKDREELRLCEEIKHGKIPAYTDRADLCRVLAPLQWPLLTKDLCDGNRHATGNN